MTDIPRATVFLDLLAGGNVNEAFTFQLIPEAPDAATAPAVLHGRLGDVVNELAAANTQGCGVFVMVNRGDGVKRTGASSCRTNANVVGVRAVFVDLDGAPIKPVLSSSSPPNWVVQSSPGRWHAYWLVHDCRLDEFSRVQAALAARFNGDPAVKDLARVMRIPGFAHQKAAPFTSELYLPDQFDGIQENDDA